MAGLPYLQMPNHLLQRRLKEHMGHSFQNNERFPNTPQKIQPQELQEYQNGK